MPENVDDTSSTKASASSQPNDVTSQIRSEFEKQEIKNKVQSMFGQYTTQMDDRLKKAFGSILRGLQKEAEDADKPIGSPGALSIEGAFDLAYETLMGRKFGVEPEQTEPEEPPVEEEGEPSPPGKQATAKSKGVATQVTEDKDIEIGDVPTEDAQMYVDVANTIRAKTKTAKTDTDARKNVQDIIKQLVKEKAAKSE